MGWETELRALIQKNWAVGRTFTLAEIYNFERHFAEIYPSNRHRKAKLRQTLQRLRDTGYLEFLDNYGRYRRNR